MADPADRREELRALVSRLGLTVRDLSLLDRALTHASASGEAPDLPGNNESLEFLGDAVLGLAVSHWLFQELPGLAPGEYTQLRARVVRKRAVARAARALDVSAFIRLGKGEEAAGGRTREGLLADCMEAVIGALYLDAGWEAARAFVVDAFGEELAQARDDETGWDYRSRLQHLCQANRWPLPEFAVLREHGPDHAKEFEVEVRVRGELRGAGRARTKKQAEQIAARAALESLGHG